MIGLMSTPPPPVEPTPRTRWETHHDGPSWQHYVERFAALHHSGADVDGEARFVDVLLPRSARVLDAGCGTGRVAHALRRAGHDAVGVDRDGGLVAVARHRYPDGTYLVGDLLAVSAADLMSAGAPAEFDAIVLAGNVLVFVAPGTERAVLANLAGLLVPGGCLVTGFATDRDYQLPAFHADVGAVGLTVEHAFSTWHLDPWVEGAEFCVTVLRKGRPVTG